ncbi:citrate lyase acyl carrier protein [Candidatus Xianfuyuplasma coldseepsis]|uniref:Citrate lyase acyl carrier protein n=1 Tax=Candidatus Xianfuyuplasma coldseepsis TaxID=2782163 RepID=A0A7L7KP67_9MOLU|nr:citrate lyase acyl carrier protein [Xianfuyuplasma coldseepsis]QMS84325.1 citrate lyase acyl carrier protein [Xianfuyuplasma coldseepsis]
MIHTAGTTESSDCRIHVSPSEGIQIQIESIVFDQFGDQIYAVISTVLQEHNITDMKVECFDKGALDYTIRSRVITALKRGGYIE